MEIPDRVAKALDGETVQSAVNLGDEDLICFTPTRSILYTGEGLLSDESIKTFDHDIERLGISQGRRKTKFSLEYVDTVKSFSVTKKRGEQVLQRLLAGVLGASGVIDDEETVAGVFLFSELTVVITEKRLIKHVGSYVWDPDFEEYPYSDVTGLDFEEGSVATQIVLSVSGRPERIKAPNDKAKKLKRTLTSVLFSYHEVSSLAELNELLGDDEAETDQDDAPGLALDDSISPLVSDEDDTADASAGNSTDEAEPITGDGPTLIADSVDADGAEAADTDTDEQRDEPTTETAAAAGAGDGVDPAQIEEMQEQIATLTAAVEKQNEQLESQRETIQQLIKELQRHA